MAAFPVMIPHERGIPVSLCSPPPLGWVLATDPSPALPFPSLHCQASTTCASSTFSWIGSSESQTCRRPEIRVIELLPRSCNALTLGGQIYIITVSDILLPYCTRLLVCTHTIHTFPSPLPQRNVSYIDSESRPWYICFKATISRLSIIKVSQS